MSPRRMRDRMERLRGYRLRGGRPQGARANADRHRRAEDLDRTVPPALTRRYLDRIPGAELAVLERTGHMGTITRPAEFANLDRDFASRYPDVTFRPPRDGGLMAHEPFARFRARPAGWRRCSSRRCCRLASRCAPQWSSAIRCPSKAGRCTRRRCIGRTKALARDRLRGAPLQLSWRRRQRGHVGRRAWRARRLPRGARRDGRAIPRRRAMGGRLLVRLVGRADGGRDRRSRARPASASRRRSTATTSASSRRARSRSSSSRASSTRSAR